MDAAMIAATRADVNKIEPLAEQHVKRLQQKLILLLDIASVQTVLTTHTPAEGCENYQTVKAAWDKNDKICKSIILNSLSNELFDVYCSLQHAADIWNALIKKYVVEDAGIKKYAIGNFLNFKMTDEKEVSAQVHDFYIIVNELKAEGIIKIMSYNIFNLKYIKLHERMKTISRLIQRHSPDIILLQEVTPNIYKFFQSCNWWGIYECSVRPEKATRQFFCMLLSKLPVKSFFYKHFENTNSGKGLSVAKITTGSNKTLIIATCHLKSPTPGNKYMAERVSQAKEALELLKSSPNVVLGGDMNWDDSADGPFPLIGRWCDAWSILRPDENGYTYDTMSNGMLNHSRSLQKRLDRFICRLKHFKMISIEIIGTEAIPGISYKSKGKKLPVLPSDHYGLILTISPK